MLWGFVGGGHNLFGVPVRLSSSLQSTLPETVSPPSLPPGVLSSSSLAGGTTLLGPNMPLSKKYLRLALEKADPELGKEN